MRFKFFLPVVTSLALLGSFGASTAAASDPALERQSPYMTFHGKRCIDSDFTLSNVEIIGYDSVWGTAQLHLSAWCGSVWATMRYGAKLDSNEYGNAHIRNSRGIDYTCDTPGGNKRVTAGQTTCYTPMTNVYQGSGGSFWAEGYHYLKNAAGAWYMVGFGATAKQPG
ncbi:DUF2690 domain-containing protein [Amycolatopsis sp. NPDC098790]|uniref:DUF2690 domain-containing protein n=1 Tax=Amycolatopsis sp. NPDC098790 TaxID=3363939 RepID=UPI0038063911